MAKFHSPRYPSLVVHDLGVRFEAGVLEVPAKVAVKLRELAHMGVVEVAPEKPVKDAKADAAAVAVDGEAAAK